MAMTRQPDHAHDANRYLAISMREGKRRAPLAPTEAQFQRSVLELAAWRRWRVYHTRLSIGSHRGFPDVIACRRDRIVALELKSERGKPTSDQVDWLAALADAGVEAHLVRPSDWSMLEELLR